MVDKDKINCAIEDLEWPCNDLLTDNCNISLKEVLGVDFYNNICEKIIKEFKLKLRQIENDENYLNNENK